MLEEDVPSISWPADGLETVAACPLCGSDRRVLAYADLRDWFFECAPGAWSLYECQDCGSAYLDPRPNAATIGRAYRSYYTHAANPGPVSQTRRVWHRLRADYLKAAFGAADAAALWPGRWLVRMFPGWRQGIDATFGRNLPRIDSQSSGLLDIGCGNGHFLEFARSAGWKVKGIDFDPAAVQIARSKGLDVQEGSVSLLEGESSLYDCITLSHVLEHVHDPLDLLRSCHRLLKPGGVLWLETPNMNSAGRNAFGAYWRGLEAPRHLTLFSRQCLLDCLAALGFRDIQDRFSSFSTEAMWRESRIIVSRAGASRTLAQSLVGRIKAEIQAHGSPECREFITLVCKK
jgi:2-polyprenyl-3-methyl-5-hydroxy-6-metoxy-1,4-benzoquinol methylase